MFSEIDSVEEHYLKKFFQMFIFALFQFSSSLSLPQLYWDVIKM